ncbi:MAG TPA: hypothetical protein VJ724_00095 [Tahibacter sp.]|nr:hypothetical protein [Tahibacter sp.]
MSLRWSVMLGLLLIATCKAQAAEFSTLEERMKQSEFNAAGLGKLTPDELKALNDWLRIHGLAPGAPVAKGESVEFYPVEKEREAIEARIDGKLTGWLGKTVFRLDNGQVWQQAETSQRSDLGLTNPAVRIKPMLLGSWLMTIEGCGCSLRVKRIK